MSKDGEKRICLGAFAGAHGVKGAALIKAFTESPESVAAYGPVETEDGARRFTLNIIRVTKPGVVMATAPEIKSREDALSLKGQRLYVNRDLLPAPEEDEFYMDDLIGLKAVSTDGKNLGRVCAIYNFGAGDLLELEKIPGIKGKRMIPFTKAFVPAIDFDASTVTINTEAHPLDDEEEKAV